MYIVVGHQNSLIHIYSSYILYILFYYSMLVYNVSFCCTVKRISYMYTYILSFLYFIPIWSPQSTE